MSEPFLAEVKIVGFNFAPRRFAECDGQILPINQNQALFSLLGTTYGGDGRTSFALPDLRGRAPVHFGTGAGLPTVNLGARGGEEEITLSEGQLPSHTHGVDASADIASSPDPDGRVLAKKARFGPDFYAASANLTSLDPNAVTRAGGGQPHENRQPYLGLRFVIALQGLFPSRS